MLDAPKIDAAALHASIVTIDTHIDIPWPSGPDAFSDDPRGKGTRRVDIPKMTRGGLGAGCFAAYVPQGRRDAEGSRAAGERALAMLSAINAMGGNGQGDRTERGVTARVTVTADAIEQARRDGVIAVIPCVENGYAMGEDLGMLARFRALGARYLTLTHNGHNLLCDSSNPRQDLGDGETLHGGLSELGRAAIGELNRLGMLVDISHVSRQAALQAAMLSKTPVLATHSCVRALCDVPRNVDDQLMDAVRDCGGMINVTAVPSFLKKGARADAVTVSAFVDHVEYIVRRVGLAHAGISSDFDGGGGFVGWEDAADSANITAELVKRGHGEAEVAALWGGNFLRLLRVAEDAADA
ncbi:MAG: dipeptidase [Pseudomonadota bacterium]|nr:dipeptidase [Pseudomonadota bacterium]